MPATYEPIATTTLGSAAASITFSSIAGTYTDLRLVIVGNSSATTSAELTFNSDTGSNYSSTRLSGDGSTASSARNTSRANILLPSFYTGSNPTMTTIDIFSYAGSTFKTLLHTGSNDQNGSGTVNRGVSLWQSTSAITRIDLAMGGFNFNTGTTATLYGIKNA